MQTLTKWKLQEILSFEEAMEVLCELYGGAKKRLVYDKNTINPILARMYKEFKSSDEQAELCLNFSETPCKNPFISTNLLDGFNPSHKIRMEELEVFLYE